MAKAQPSNPEKAQVSQQTPEGGMRLDQLKLQAIEVNRTKLGNIAADIERTNPAYFQHAKKYAQLINKKNS